jgi:putative DNA primase/helicase
LTFAFQDWQRGDRAPKGFDIADCIDNGWSREDVNAMLKAAVCDELSDFPEEQERTMRNEYAAGEGHDNDDHAEQFDAPAGPLQPTNRPVIQYLESELPAIVDNACQALIDAEVKVYARGTSLARPVRLASAGQAKRIKRGQGATILVPIDETALVEILTGSIEWRKYDGRSDKWKPMAAPAAVAKTILARRGDWPFPQLVAVVTAPTLRDDWSILSEPGFDQDSGIYFDPGGVVWPIIKPTPTRAEALTALGSLSSLLADFPFVGPADRAGALAMILTALVRPSLPTAPLFGVSAPVPGSGKSKLVDIAAILATGRNAAVMSAPREEAELQKAVGAALMAGDGFLNLDNVEHSLRSELLCQVLTQELVKLRVLGQSLNLDLPTNVTFAATGNGLRFAGDLTRRVVLISLDPGMERPEERIFKQDAIEVARQGRVQFVTAGLTILRAFIAAKAQAIRPALGSFEVWSNLVRSALMWLDEADPLSNSHSVRDNDPERERTLGILRALPDGEWRASDLAAMLKEDEPRMQVNKQHVALADALSEFCDRGSLSTRRLGDFLRHHAGRVLDGISVRWVKKDRNGIAVWTVEGRERQEISRDPVEW